MISIISGASSWDRPCYQSMLNYNSESKCKKPMAI